MGGSGSKESHTDIASVWFPDFEANQVPSLEGKIVAVTGCTSGTGLVVAKTCARKGAKAVLLLNRPSPRSDAADALVKSQVPEGSTTTVETVPCDLQDFDSVKKAAALIKSKYEAIDVLCNNAGVMALEDVATKDGYDVQMQTNHLSHFLLTKELYPLLKRAAELRGEARVVNHSSGMRQHPNHPLKAEYLEKKGGQLGGNASGYLLNGPRWERYHQTKLANAVFTLALKDRLGAAESGIKAVCAAPGAAATNLQITAVDSGAMSEVGLRMGKFMSQSAEDGAMPILRACFDPDTNNGDFYEPSQYLAMRGPAVKVEYDKLSSDPDARTLLWEKSEEACGKFEI